MCWKNGTEIICDHYAEHPYEFLAWKSVGWLRNSTFVRCPIIEVVGNERKNKLTNLLTMRIYPNHVAAPLYFIHVNVRAVWKVKRCLVRLSTSLFHQKAAAVVYFPEYLDKYNWLPSMWDEAPSFFYLNADVENLTGYTPNLMPPPAAKFYIH